MARNVHLESLRKVRNVSQEVLSELADTVPQRQSEVLAIEALHACLEECLAKLPGEKRSLLLRYYQGDKSGEDRF